MNYRFLVDECTGRRLSMMLNNAGYDTIFVGDWKPSAHDEEVLHKAKSDGRILITEDKDFGELVFRLLKPSCGIILIRTSTTLPEKRFNLIEKLIKSIDVNYKFIVIKDSLIKTRRIK